MYTLLLTIIYMAFISLGLPDSLLGSAWPSMQVQMAMPLSYMGIISMIISAGTIFSSLMSERITKKFGTGLVTAISVFMTAIALFAFSVSNTFWLLCICAIPYGLGAGAIDAALNNYVALNYTSRYMNWLHCFWGVGAAISPYIMGYCLTGGVGGSNSLGWSMGYKAVAAIQIVITIILFISLPLWKKQKFHKSQEENSKPIGLKNVFQIKGVKYILIAFFGYCALETTAGLWASSYLVLSRGISSERAARYASFFYLGITAGRFICGFVADKIGDRNIIRVGIGVILVGIIAIVLPLTTDWVCLYGLIIIGLGCAPIYPAIIHSTPENFGTENSQAVVGVQMASAYMGSTLIPPLFGFMADKISIHVFSGFIFVLLILIIVTTERLNKVVGGLCIHKNISETTTL